MSQKSDSSSPKSPQTESSNPLKRRHLVDTCEEGVPAVETHTDRSPKRLTTEATAVNREGVDQSVMEDSEHFFGRGRGHLRSNKNRTQNGVGVSSTTEAPNISPTPPKQRSTPSPTLKSSASTSATKPQNSSPSPAINGQPLGAVGGEEEQKRKIKQQEERYGITMDLLNDYMNPFASVTATPVARPPVRSSAYLWVEEDEKKAKEVKEEEEKLKEKKYLGKQYVTAVQQKERERVIQTQKNEMEGESTSTRAQSSDSNNPVLLRHANRMNQDVNTSSMTLSTDIESVGTFRRVLPNVPDTIEEAEDMTPLIERYFGSTKPKRVTLPINQYEERIISAVTVNRVVIIEGVTGCGKTTQVPQYIADDCAAKGLPFNIVVTQPRRIAAKSIARRVADERNWELGSIVGYQIGMDREFVNEDTRICYCTTGVLLQRLIGTQKLDMYSHIIIDEVHERSIETDLLLLVIKKLMNIRSHSVKIVLMSATFDPQQLIEYFTIPIYEGQDIINEVRPTYLKIKEIPHKLSIFYMTPELKKELNIMEMPARDIRERDRDPIERDVACVSTEAMEFAFAILTKGLMKIEGKDGTRGSVLVFLPGLEEIHEMKAKLDKSPESRQQQWKIHPLHSSIPLDKQNEIFSKPRGNERKIILATNIAESSITVPDVSYVIDFCLTKTLVCDVETHIPVLRMEWAAKSNCNQRAGRAGRVRDGRVYRLVADQFYRKLPDFSMPELVRSPLDLSILRVKMLGMGSPKELLGLALDPPDLSDIYHSVLTLKQVGAFAVKVTDKSHPQGIYYDEEDGDITTMGTIMSRLPVDIRLSKLIVMGHVFDVLEDTIIIAACLSSQGMFRRDFSQGLNAYKSRLAWADRSFSDSIAHLNAYKMFKKFHNEFSVDKKMAEKWCKQNYLQYKRLLEVDYMFGDLSQRLARDNIVVPQRPNMRRNRHEEELILKVVMCAAFYPNYFTRNEIDCSLIPKMLSNRDPHNSVQIAGFPPNEGPLYTNPIREMFSICAKRIDLNFEETKAYITFIDDRHPLKEAFDLHIPSELRERELMGSQMSLDSSIKSESRAQTPMSSISSSTLVSSSGQSSYKIKSLKETTIKTAVYVAVAMRNHREVNKDIPKLDSRVTRERLQRLNKYKEEEQEMKWQSFRSNRISVPHSLTRIKLTKLDLPALDCSEMEIRITHVNNPSDFYAQYAHEITTTALKDLSYLINYDTDTIPCESETALVGDLCIATYTDTDGALMYGRARIDNIDYKMRNNIVIKEVESVQVFFIDYGFRKTFDNIQKLGQINARANHRLLEIPPQAFKCALSHVNPSAITCFDNCWSKKAIDCFKGFVRERKTLTAKIYSVINRVVRLELYDNINRQQSLNDILIGHCFAEKWEESGQSKLNHDQRRATQMCRDDSLGQLRLDRSEKPGVYNPDDVVEIEIDSNTSEDQRIRSHEKITIKGPFNPLECSFTGLCRQSSNRSVRIERDSVNCVVLEANYLSKHTRLIVASNVGLSQNNGNINLRDTTLMPNIRGFPALMALLFAPRVQLRADKERKQLIGAICGIGYDRRTMKGYDPENDAEVAFDADISRHDLVKINIIRYNISNLLKSRESLREYTDGSLAIAQRKVRRNIIELLDRRRRLQNNSSYFPTYKWSDISKDDLNCALNKKETELNSELLPLCEQIALQDYDYYEDVGENLETLKQVQEGLISMTTMCKLCNVRAYSFQDITSHINSNEHMDAVNDFNKFRIINENEKKKEEYYKQQEDEGIDETEELESEVFDIDSDDD